MALENSAHDQPRDAQTFIEGPADTRSQPIVAHAFFAETHGRRMHHDRYAETGNQFEKRFGSVVIGIGMLVARVDEHAVQAIFDDGPLQSL